MIVDMQSDYGARLLALCWTTADNHCFAEGWNQRRVELAPLTREGYSRLWRVL